jgi:alcohol dehydrogenase, propanol-preferring
MTAVRSFALHHEHDHNVEELPLQVPEPQGREVVVDITHAGVCHTDIHVRDGGYDLGSAGWMSMVDRGVTYPLVMGHEIAGVISAVGPDVTGRRIGEEVVVYPWLGCGQCAVCETGMENLCTEGSRILGIMRSGGYAEKVSVPDEKYCVPLDGVDAAWGATLACSGITAVSSADQVMSMQSVEKNTPVAVLGAGGVGLMCVAALSAAGLENITVLDRSDANFERARGLGARNAALISDDTTAADIRAITGEAPAAVLDVVNSGETCKLGFESIRKGGRLVLVGLFGGEVTIPTVALPLGQKSIVGNYVGGLGHLSTTLQLARDGRLPRIPLTTQPMSARSVEDTLNDLEGGRSRGRTVLTLPR